MIMTQTISHAPKHSRLLFGYPALLACCLSLLTGCPDEDGGSTSTPDMTTQMDMGGDLEVDEGLDMPDMRPSTEPDQEDMCIPLTQCPQDTCGMQSDGCGGQIDCGACTCQGGVPSSPSCGVCGLGSARCEGDTIVCDVPRLDEGALSNCSASVVYVDAGYTGFSSGTQNEPFKSLDEALAEFGEDPLVKLYLLKEGNYTGKGFALPQGTSIIGGFDNNWLYQPNRRSRLDLEHTSDARAYGILVEGETEPITLGNLEVRLVAGIQGGEDYMTPIEVRRSSSLTLWQVKTLSLDGVAGLLGEPGQPGQSGANGSDAEQRGSDPAKLLQPGLAPLGPEECLGSQGGNGGRGGSATNAAIAPDNGSAPLMGMRVGGDKGTEQTPAGQNGANGYSASGQGNAAPDPPDGMLLWAPILGDSEGRFRYSHNSDGATGQDGQDGGGGTGGGGGFRYTPMAGPDAGTTFSGGAGGAGGAGGCGGKGGSGGQGGGSSFGLVLVASPMTLIYESIFEAKRGGNGASGGRGGNGGGGGNGGLGTFAPTQNSGGKGGNGGRGQNGANGAPGSGGYSVGVMCSEPLATSIESIEAIGSTPGQGGKALDSLLDAPSGQTARFFGCE